MQHIVVLGAGPAGTVCALGLHRLGYAVTVVTIPRLFSAIEGVSERVLSALKQAGLDLALATVDQACVRQVVWNAVDNAQNHEFLLDRPSFDRALIAQLEQEGIRVLQQSAVKVVPTSSGFQVWLNDGHRLNADFLVEARGRQASASGKGVRGPEALSLLNRWQGQPTTAKTTVTSVPDGWSWMAQLADGRCYWQLTLDVNSAHLPPKQQLLDYCTRRRLQCAVAQSFFADQPCDVENIDFHARSSTSTLSQACVGQHWIRIGDAAMAVDPLSGNGIFQSLSSALQAPAVIHTLLQRPENMALAQQFHQTRVENLFMRFARLGRDFYQQEQQWPTEPFWQARRQWPDQALMHQETLLDDLQVVERPVVQHSFIVGQSVVVTPDQPLGIWHVDGIALAPFVKQMKARGLEAALLEYDETHQRVLRHWLASVVTH